MIDTHCHLLPAIDDGPRRSADAIELARQLVEAGVHTVVCTPHFSRRFPTDHELAMSRLEGMRETLAAAELPLRLLLAAEVGPAAAIESQTSELWGRRIGDQHLLVELERDTPAGFIEDVIARLNESGLKPVLAHPERCRAVRSQPRLLDSARAAGGVIHVVAPSLTGGWGSGAASAAWQLLESARVDLIASDAHRPVHASQHLADALESVSARLGSETVVKLTETNPANLIGTMGWSA